MRWLIGFFLVMVPLSLRGDSHSDWASKIHEIHLSNGLNFLFYERGEAPIFSAYIRFRAGGIDEPPGKTGLAHFLEHMAFKGTQTLGTTDFKKEKPLLDEIEKVGEELSREYTKANAANTDHIKELREKLRALHKEEEKYIVKEAIARKMMENGGVDLNATTSKDMTSYFVNLPSDKLKFWASVESERIFKPVFREFYEEKDVVLEERRMRVDNDPDGRLYEAFLSTAFEKSPYRWPTIGSVDDVLRLTRHDLENFWKRYYRPSRFAGVLVGNLNQKEVESVLNQTFGKIRFEDPSEKSSDLADHDQEPVQKEERRVVLKMAAKPRFLMGYHKPAVSFADDYAFDLLDQILGDGRSSRLYRELVVEKKLVSGVGTSTDVPGLRLPNLYLIEVNPLPGHSSEEVVALIDQEIQKIQEGGVTSAEFEKAKNRLMAAFLFKMETNEEIASRLSYFQTAIGNWRYLANYLDEINRLKIEDVQRVVKEYLRKNNRTIAEIKSSEEGMPSP